MTKVTQQDIGNVSNGDFVTIKLSKAAASQVGSRGFLYGHGCCFAIEDIVSIKKRPIQANDTVACSLYPKNHCGFYVVYVHNNKAWIRQVDGRGIDSLAATETLTLVTPKDKS